MEKKKQKTIAELTEERLSNLFNNDLVRVPYQKGTTLLVSHKQIALAGSLEKYLENYTASLLRGRGEKQFS